MMKRIICLAVVTALVYGCATNPDKIDAAYVSPMKYKGYDCDQIAVEMDHVGHRTTSLYHKLKQTRNNDNIQMGIGLILFWPALFFLEGGDGPEAAEYAQLKGEHEALRQSAVAQKCNITTQSPEEIIKDAQEAEKAAAGEEA
jgi:hypothetical protein